MHGRLGLTLTAATLVIQGGCSLDPAAGFAGSLSAGFDPADDGAATEGGTGDIEPIASTGGDAAMGDGDGGGPPPGNPSTSGGDDGDDDLGDDGLDDNGLDDNGSTGGLADGCPSDSLADTTAFPYQGQLAAGTAQWSGSCGGDGGEFGVAFTADEAGLYTFDTIGSSFDTVLYVQDGDSCGAAELACDDDGAAEATSRVQVQLAAGQSVIVMVDAYAIEDTGAFTLNAALLSASCDADDLGNTLPTSASGVTSGASQVQGECGGDEGPEAFFEWTAPAAGTYRISTAGSGYDTVLHVHDSGCLGAELACDDDGAGDLHSQLDVTLAASQQIGIVVDSYDDLSGPFELTISAAP